MSPPPLARGPNALLSERGVQFRPPEQRWVFKLRLFIDGRVITPGSQSRRPPLSLYLRPPSASCVPLASPRESLRARLNLPADKLAKNAAKATQWKELYPSPAAKWDFFEMQISGARLVNFSRCQHHNKIQMWLFVRDLSSWLHLLPAYLLALIYYADLNKRHQKEGLLHNGFLSSYIKVFEKGVRWKKRDYPSKAHL